MWDGSLASKGWLFVRKRLQQYDDPVTAKYHGVVLERVLQLNQETLPSWLVDLFLLRNPHQLVSAAIRYDRLDEAFAFCLTILSGAQEGRKDVPYPCIDQLLQLPNDEDTASLSSEEIASRQADLRKAIDKHLATLSSQAAKAKALIPRAGR